MTLLTHGDDLNVTLLNPNTQRAQTLIRSYRNTTRGNDIYKAYKKPSSRKVAAFQEIKKEMKAVGGYGIKITGAGSDFFSCAYKVEGDDDNIYLIYHTAINRFAICL